MTPKELETKVSIIIFFDIYVLPAREKLFSAWCKFIFASGITSNFEFNLKLTLVPILYIFPKLVNEIWGLILNDNQSLNEYLFIIH